MDVVDERGRYLNLPSGRLHAFALMHKEDFGNAVRELHAQQAPMAEQNRQLQSSLTDATNRLAEAENSERKSGRDKMEVLKLRGEVICTAARDALPVTLNATARGFPDYELRAAAREVKEHEASLPLQAKNQSLPSPPQRVLPVVSWTVRRLK